MNRNVRFCLLRVVAALVLVVAAPTITVLAAPKDRKAPTVKITSPADGATVTGIVVTQGTATDNVAVAKVEASIDSGTFSPLSGSANWAFSWDTTLVSNGTHTITVRATDTSGLVGSGSIKVYLNNVASGAPAPAPAPSPATTVTAAGSIPSALPQRFTVGLYDEQDGGTWMHDSGVRWDSRYRYLTYGWVNNWGWGSYDGWFAANYLTQSATIGDIPVVEYYVMNGLSNYNENAFLATAQSPSRMAEYFNEWKVLMQRVKEFGKPTIVLVEGDGFGFLEQQSGENPAAYAAVSSTGMPELAGLPNTIAGWGMAFLQLRSTVGATNAILAMDISGWATGKDLLYFSVSDSLGPEVDKAYAFLAPLGLAANQTGQTWDLLANNPLDRDSGYYSTIGQNRWWDPRDVAPISSASFNRYAEWLRLWNAKAGKRWMLWQIPIGNSNSQNVYNNGGAAQGYKDNRAEYFFGDSGSVHRQTFAQDGVIGLLFGPGAAGMSFYTNDVYVDGQLFIKTRVGSFLNAGGLSVK